MSYDEHQAMWPQMIAALAAIDAELGLPDDGCNSLAQTLAAIKKLKDGRDASACNEELGPVPRWWHCDTHGPGTHTAWGCPECVREMRCDIADLKALIRRSRTQLSKWAEWYDSADHAARGQLPLPPAGDVSLSEDLSAALGPND